MDETFVYMGGSVKALGEGRVGGYLVRFGGRDLDGEYFTEKTYFGAGDGDGRDTLFHHGIPIKARIGEQVMSFDELADTSLGAMKTKRDEIGIWAEAVLNMADNYQRQVYELVEAGKLGWSSGAAGHTVRKSKDGEITRWIIAEGSLTPTPAEPRNVSMPLKAFLKVNEVSDSQADEVESPEAQTIPEAADAAGSAANETAVVEADTKQSHNVEVIEMSEDQKATQNDAPPAKSGNDAGLKSMEARMDAMAERLDGFLKRVEEDPRVSRSGYFTVDGETADKSIKNVGDMLIAMKRRDTKRLSEHYGLKASETVDGPSGGYLLTPGVVNELDMGFSLNSPILNLVRVLPVGDLGMSGHITFPHIRVTPDGTGQTASAAGVTTSKRRESGSYTAKDFLLDRINWDVSDVASGELQASYEQAQSAPIIEALFRMMIEEAVNAKVEYSVFQGTGAGEPLGVLNWGGTIGVTEDTDNTFAAADSDEMMAKLLRGSNARAAWFYHNGAYQNMAGFVRDNVFALSTNRGQEMSTALHGLPHYPTQQLPAQGSDGYVVLGDWSKYILFDYGGLYVRYSDQRYIDEGKVAWFFGRLVDGKPIMPTSVTLADGTYTVSPFVKLNNNS